MNRMKLILLCLLLPIAGTSGSASADFYTNALEEGRAFFQEARYKEALERLEFAAFGLLNQPVLMRRVRGYSALALFQLSRFDEARGTLETLKADPKDLQPLDLKIDPAEAALFRVMMRTLYPEKDFGANTGTRRSFELVFQDALEAAARDDWPRVEEGIERLGNLIPDDPRVAMLNGMAHFNGGRFKEAFLELTSVRDSIQAEFRDRLLFFLVRASERVEEYGQARRAYAAIEDNQIRDSLEPVLRAVVERRERDVAALARDFDRSLMRKLVERFPGDSTLALAIWTEAGNNQTLTNPQMETLAMELARFEEAADRRFFLQVAAWLEAAKRVPQALKFLEKSRFAREFSAANVDFLYQLGRLQGVLGKSARARELMRRILTLQPDHRAARNYVQNMQTSTAK